MKILQIDKYPSIKGGAETILFESIRLLAKAGHDVILYATDEGTPIFSPTYTTPYFRTDSSFEEKIKGIGKFFYNREAASTLEKIIIEHRPDIAHIHLYLNSMSVSILPVLKKYKIPVVMTLHDYRQICPSYLLFDKNQKICEKCKKHNYLNCLLTRCSKGSFAESSMLTFEMFFRRLFFKTEKYVDKFICVSKFEYEKHREFNKAISDKSVVIYNPVEINPAPVYKRGHYFLYFGRLSREKGLLTLISAFKELPHLELKIAGSGILPLEDIPSNIELLGFKKKEELNNLIKDAAYIIMPSECYETFGLSCGESLSLGTPVIASDIGAIPEIVGHNKNGFLFNPQDKASLIKTVLNSLAISDEEYFSLCENGYQAVNKFSEDKYLKALLSLYEKVIVNRR